jgi:hypothetical protein
MRTAITAITWLGAAAVFAWGWASQGWDLERGLTLLAVREVGWLVSWLVHKVAELDRRVQSWKKPISCSACTRSSGSCTRAHAAENGVM